MKRILTGLTTIILIISLFPIQVLAYSYGDPNKEDVAEAYKQMLVELEKKPPNYKNANAIFETVKNEIEMHMGSEVTIPVMDALEKEDKEAAITSMQEILVLNIARRFDSIDKDFTNFSNNKKLLAKAFATYEALAPIVQMEDQALDQRIRAEYNKALESLGNPGLFGVGVKEPNYPQFQESEEMVVRSLQKLFNIEKIEVGHFAEGEVTPAEGQNKIWTDVTDWKNWVPLLLIVLSILAVFAFVRRKRK